MFFTRKAIILDTHGRFKIYDKEGKKDPNAKLENKKV